MDRPDMQFWYGQTRYANLLWTDQMYKAGMNGPEEQPWHGETRYTNIYGVKTKNIQDIDI